MSQNCWPLIEYNKIYKSYKDEVVTFTPDGWDIMQESIHNCIIVVIHPVLYGHRPTHFVT